MQVGDVDLLCDELDDDGAGVGAAGALRLHVAGALPGERALAAVEHVSPHARGTLRPAWGRLIRILSPSPDRVEPVCPAYGRCGGCVVQHLAYPAQLEWKRARVVAALARHPALDRVEVRACVASPRTLEYRNQAKYVYGRGPDGRAVLGAYAPRTHDLVDLAGCRLLEPPLVATAAMVRDELDAARVEPFDERTRQGLLRYVVLRANGEGAVLATFVTAGPWPQAVALAAALRARAPSVVGVVHNVNPTAGNVIFGDEEHLLSGSATLEDGIGPARVELASRSFFQVNRFVAALAYQAIWDAAGSASLAVDAFAGAGGIAFGLAARGAQVIAIEENAAATAAAARFAATRGPRNVTFITGDVATHLGAVQEAEVVVLNPPRRGCAPAVLEATARLRPRLVAYLSCNPQTLARDLGHLARHGLVARAIVPYDMLPHTPHVEALAMAEQA